MTNLSNAQLLQGAKIRNIIAGVAAAIGVTLILIPGVYHVIDARQQISDLELQAKKISQDLSANRSQYRKEKVTYALRAKKEAARVMSILPAESEKTSIVRMLEAYSDTLPGPHKFQSATFAQDEQKNTDYIVSPFKVSLNLTKDALMSFLEYLNHTGSLAGTADANRLLSVQKVDVKISDPEDIRILAGEEKGNIDVDLTINAYSLPKQK